MRRIFTYFLFLAALLALPQGVRANSPEVTYMLHCSGCHGLSGAGNPAGGIPPFRDKVGVFSHLAEGRRYVANVPGVVGSSLNAAEIAEVLNYVMDTWAGPSLARAFIPFDEAEVAAYLRDPVADPVVLRREVAKKLEAQGLSVPEYPWP